MTEFTPELIEQARAAESAEELLALAKENGMENFTEESAQAYFELLHPKTGEVSDEELENVTGGGCYKNGLLIVTTYTTACEDGYRCHHCHKGYKDFKAINVEGVFTSGLYKVHKCATAGYDVTNSCNSCSYLRHKNGLYLCANPIKSKK